MDRSTPQQRQKPVAVFASRFFSWVWTHAFAVVLVATLLFFLIRALYILWLGINQPLLDYYSFRQTQTAISVYWLWKEGLGLVYETPVLGYPWAIPFEFPLYQWLVALLRFAGVPIDVGGRLVSFGFYIATLYPLWILCRALNLGATVWLIAAILFLASPLYVYWSRTVMIESCALFFSVYSLALIAQYLIDGRRGTLVLAFLTSSLAVLVKSTTFPPYALLAGSLVLWSGLTKLREGHPAVSVRQLASAFGVLGGSFLIGLLWVWYADSVKSANPFGAELTSTKLMDFTLGTWDQRFSAEFWRKAILDRALPEIFGNVTTAAIAAAAALQSRRYGILMLAAALGFVLPFLLFTNLHFHHSYYQYANGLLGLLAVALGIAAVAKMGQPLLAALFLTTILAGHVAVFQETHAPPLHHDWTKDPLFRIAKATRSFVPDNKSILVLGQDLSSAVPYYSRRKSLMLPSWMPPGLTKQALDDPERFLGGQKLGGIVYCTSYTYDDEAPLIDAAITGREVIAEAGPCKLLGPTR